MAETLAERQARKPVIKLAEVVKEGEKIILPTNMSNSEAIAHLQRLIKMDEETITPSETFDAFPWDGAYSLTLALKELFGWYATENMFGTPLRNVETGPDTTVQVPWGRFTVPQIPKAEGFLQTSTAFKGNRVVFVLTGSMRRKYEPIFQQIVAEVKRQLSLNSLYKGKAFRIKFRDDDNEALPIPEISFIKLNREVLENLVLSRKVERQVVTHVFTPIEKYQLLKKFGLPFKRGVLLAGIYGVGKTMISTATAIKATDNGITFILCSNAKEFTQALEFARGNNLAPAVVFCEDIDRVTSGERDAAMDHIFNTLDGVEAKKSEVMAIVTTNDAESMHQGMLRPGRIDAAFEITPPDAEAVERLIRVYAKGQLAKGIDLTAVGKALAGQVPAVVQAAVHDAKLYALSQDINASDVRITAEALIGAIDGKEMQLALLNGKRHEEVEPIVVAAHVLGRHLAFAMRAAGEFVRNTQPEFAKVVDEEVKALTD